MDKIDGAKVARVWQRVKTEQPEQPVQDGLPELIAGTWTAAAVYARLAKKMTGKATATLQKMAQQEEQTCACLKGIYTLTKGKPPEVRAVLPGETEPLFALRRCYGQTLQRASRYREQSSDPEYGQVFGALEKQAQEQCLQILELVGNLKKRQRL